MKWTPQTLCATMLVATICIIFLMVEVGILKRSDHADVSDSRQLLDGNLKLIIGLLTGFLLGKHISNNKP